MNFYRLIRPLAFALPPETAHNVGLSLGKHLPLYRQYWPPKEHVVNLGGITFPSPLGLAAGFDKTGSNIPVFAGMGFGSLELGTFTPKAQTGNPKPRLWRYAKEAALQNKMGFNNPGIEKGLHNIENALQKSRAGRPAIGISIGRGKETSLENALHDYEICAGAIKAQFEQNDSLVVCDYIAVNISSPNTPGLRELQGSAYVRQVVEKLAKLAGLPVFVKFAPDISSEKDFLSSIEAALQGGASAIILTNTSIDYSLVKNSRLADERGGGISGRPLRQLSEKALTLAKSHFPVAHIISSGGVLTPQDALRRILMGATLVQVYSGLVYHGPLFCRDFSQLLARTLETTKFSTLTELQAGVKAGSFPADVLESLF
ncbi:MAG: quinone-dependent dihydroorotate dehydrogenase [Leptospiraceae bacterium]|nr:quinone-dependent dihydroorotate dehydrogenase [Leptospiraceae bacterium]